jgi:hypothetical protein
MFSETGCDDGLDQSSRASWILYDISLPEPDNRPATSLKLLVDTLIAPPVRGDLRDPVGSICAIG